MCKKINQTMLGIFSSLVIVLTVSVLVFNPTIAWGVPDQNQATGDIAGNNGALTNSNIFNLSSQQLALLKRAFLSDGTVVADSAVLPIGTVVKFMLYVDNQTDIQVDDVRIVDVLDGATFSYTAASLAVVSTGVNCAGASCTGPEEAAMFAAADPAADCLNAAGAATGAVCTDAAGAGDVGSITGATINVGKADALNDQLDVPANSQLVVLLTTTML